MIIAYYFNTWTDSSTHVQIEQVADGCDYMEIHDALAAYLALKDISVRDWAIEVISNEQLIDESIDDMLKRGERLIREQNE